MVVAELVALKTFRISERETPEPGPGQLQVKVGAIGICGSDMHVFAEGGIGDTLCNYPVILGHEPAGTILKAGPGVTGYTVGANVALEPAIVCYHCEMCLKGKFNLCEVVKFMSSAGEPGFFRDVVNVPAGNTIPLPKHLGINEAALIEPLSVIVHSMKFAQLQLNETAVVWGAGPIGLLTVAALKIAGAKRIWAVEPVPHRREMALAMGADAALDPAADPVKTILRDTGKRGVDVAFDCVAKGSSVNDCLKVLARAGRLIYTAIPSEIEVSFNMVAMRNKEITFYNVRRANHEFNQARDLLAAHAKLFAPLLTHTRPLDRIQDAFDLVENYADGVGKMLITP